MSKAKQSTKGAANWGRWILAAALGAFAASMPVFAAGPEVSGGAALVTVTVASGIDTDADSLIDDTESVLGTDPASADTDEDGMDDAYEVWNGLDPLNFSDASADVDDDGLTNLDEYTAGTHPFEADSDGDKFWDAIEIRRGTDPTSAESYPTSANRSDVNRDGKVDATDLQVVVNAVLHLPVPVPANVNDITTVDASDIQIVVNSMLGN